MEEIKQLVKMTQLESLIERAEHLSSKITTQVEIIYDKLNWGIWCNESWNTQATIPLTSRLVNIIDKLEKVNESLALLLENTI